MIDLFGFIRFLINLTLYPFAVIFLIFYRCLQWLGLQPINYDYQDNIVLITGSANGFGREIALAFAKAGASLALWDVDDVGNRETQQQCLAILHSRNSSGRVRIYHVDVTRSIDVYASAERVRHDLGQVTILVANAGFVSGRTLLTESDNDIERTFGVNSLSPIWLIKAFLPYMLDANRGHVVIISSVLGMKKSENILYLNTIFY
jgi:NAD(P)-dependent dehydrogenase (short-subunit alcohol dehydrogenase family)